MANFTIALQRTVIVAWLMWGISALGIAYWAFDRKLPFELRGYSITAVPRGGLAVLEAQVVRDTKRNCAATFNRYILDSAGTRFDLTGVQYSTAAAIKQIEHSSPGRLRVAVEVPDNASVGPAKVVTAVEYICNPSQRIFPLDTLFTIDMEILP